MIDKKDVIKTIRELQRYDELQKRYFDIKINFDHRREEIEMHVSQGTITHTTPEEYAERATRTMQTLEKDIRKLEKQMGESAWCLR